MNLWQRLRARNPRDLFLAFSPEGASFYSVSWNFDLKSPAHRQWMIEIHRQEKEVIQWKKEGRDELRFFKGNRSSLAKLGDHRKEAAALMNIAIHSTLKHALESHQEFMLTPVSGATTLDYESEQTSLQWIQASFGTLTRVLEKFKKDPDLLLTAAFFAGTTPETNENVVRLIAFNLDILYYLRPDHSLQIIVFDDKNKGHGSSHAPTFQQTINVTKPQFYDEIVKLTNLLAHAGELK